MSTAWVLVSDGACSQNPGPGGWGLILSIPGVGVREWGGAEPATTNNRMELFGFYRGLQEVFRVAQESPSRDIRVISDSKYVLEGAEKNLKNWSTQAWKTRAGDEVKNRDLWEKILKGQEVLVGLGFRLKYELVKGHAGSEVNERADQIAVRFSRNEPVELYSGGFANYPVSFVTEEKFEPVYLSWVGGKLERHRTWDECRARVEGKAGARYKKIKNRLEERETLEKWGVPRT